MATSDSAAQPIAANALNLTRVTGLGAVIATTGTALSAALGAFKDLPTETVIAIIAAMCVALVVTGLVLITDMRVRGRQTMHDNQLKYLRKRDRDQGVPAQNGQHQPIVPSAAERELVWHFGPIKVGSEPGE